MQILKYLLKRLATIVATISALIAVSYTMMFYSPGNYFSASSIIAQLGPVGAEDPKVAQQYIHMFKARYGLNQPVWEQIAKYIWHAFTFNFGNSFENPSITIMSTLKVAFPISAELAVGAVILALLIGIPLGVVAAIKRNTWIDALLTTLSMSGQALPPYVLAVLLILVFGVWFQGVLPVDGWGNWRDAVLPVFSLAAGNIGVVTRYMRSSLIESMRQDYIRTAESKGVPRWQIIWKHGIRNSLTALITIIGPAFAFTVVGTIWVETIFSIPGLGSLMGPAFTADDYPLAITSVFLLSGMVMVMNLVVDLAYAALDPRVTLK